MSDSMRLKPRALRRFSIEAVYIGIVGARVDDEEGTERRRMSTPCLDF